MIRKQAVPPLTLALVEMVVDRFRGDILQTPPQYSALKVAGRRAYAVARAGGEVDLAPRPVSVYSLRLLDLSGTELCLEVTCSRGTYIRALARDIAVELGTRGHLSALTRTRVGPFSVEDALSLDDISSRGVVDAVLPASCALPDAQTYSATADDALKLSNGQLLPAGGLCTEFVWVYDPEDRLVCLASADGMLLHPRLVL